MNRKIILFLIILVSICTISHAWASDEIETQIESEISDVPTIELNEEDSQVLSTDVHIINPDCENIQEVIDSANESDTICFNGTFEFKKTLKINKTLNVTGINDATIKRTWDSAANFEFFNIESSNVVLSNLKFSSSYGSAVLLQGDNGLITNCQFNNNLYKNQNGGALVLKGSNCNVTYCTFSKNQGGTSYGGAISVEGNGTLIDHCDFSQNQASQGGGAIYSNYENLTINYCNFTSNYCSDRGGAILITKSKNKISNCIFNNNNVSNLDGNSTGGGAVYSNGGLTIDYSSFSNNAASKSNGGAIVLNDLDTVKFSSFIGNSALLGNDIYTACNPTVASNNFTIHCPISESVYGISESDLKNLNNKFDIIKDKSNITFVSEGISFEYGSTSQPILVTVKGGTVTKNNIRVLNHPEAIITFSKNILTVSNLNVGKYTLRVTTTPDENHLSVDSDLQITVKKATAAIKASKVTVALKKGTLWTIKLIYSKTGKVIPNMKLTLKVFTGKKYKTVSVKTNSKGIASYQTKKLAKGVHKVIVKGSDSRYNFNTLESSIKVIKQKPLKFKVTRKTGTDGATLSIHVMNKKTKKPLNGVKVKLQIYTGKKYKTITLKTKTIKGYKGVCGYSTNKLSVGKHKVKILPNTIKYKGSATSYMKITKQAKKHNPWESKESA